jgi:competence protein CoiA
MLLGKSNPENLVSAYPGVEAYCPLCLDVLVPKCGSIKIWHFAHASRLDCDSWAQPESQWHLAWKQRFPIRNREVSIGCHRADVRLDNGYVIEFQHSPISPEEIKEREKFYGNVIWIVDGSRFKKNFDLRLKGDHHTFRWKWPRRTWMTTNSRVVIDFGDFLFLIKKVYSKCPVGGWGIKYIAEEFMEWALSKNNTEETNAT